MRYSKQEVVNLVLSMPDDMTFEIEDKIEKQCGERRIRTKFISDWYSKLIDNQEV